MRGEHIDDDYNTSLAFHCDGYSIFIVYTYSCNGDNGTILSETLLGDTTMKVWRDKSGKWITAKEFGSRFAKGIESVTPIAQTRTQLYFMWVTIIGICCGITVSIIAWKTLWWLGIILVAGLGNTIVGMIGIYQKYKQLKRIDETIRLSIQDEHKQLNNVVGEQYY